MAEAPDQFITAWDDETDASGANLIETQDAVILGRRSYDEWAAFWPGSEIQPFASFINAVPKYVATSTPLEREWTNSRVIDGGLVDFVRHLKGQQGGDIGVHASISVTQTLLAADVVDELRLVIAPTIELGALLTPVAAPVAAAVVGAEAVEAGKDVEGVGSGHDALLEYVGRPRGRPLTPATNPSAPIRHRTVVLGMLRLVLIDRIRRWAVLATA